MVQIIVQYTAVYQKLSEEKETKQIIMFGIKGSSYSEKRDGLILGGEESRHTGCTSLDHGQRRNSGPIANDGILSREKAPVANDTVIQGNNCYG